jgi:hypothetical protein
MSDSDYYRLLGIRPTANRDEIRRAYRRLARRVHPDTNPEWEDDREANARMAELNAAYAVLRDPARRVQYDRERSRRINESIGQTQTWGKAQPRWRYRTARPRPHPRPEPVQIVFRPPVDQQVTLSLLALLLLFFGVFCASGALRQGSVLNVALAGGSFLGCALATMAALPDFQGYVVLNQEGLTVYPFFGLTGEQVYRYDQICGVHWQARQTRLGTTSVRIMIDYFVERSGRVYDGYYRSKWLMAVDDPHTLFYVLRRRATAAKSAFTRPTWQAVVVGARELIGIMVAVFLLVVVAVFYSSGA